MIQLELLFLHLDIFVIEVGQVYNLELELNETNFMNNKTRE
jgi:hypothetical protein